MSKVKSEHQLFSFSVPSAKKIIFADAIKVKTKLTKKETTTKDTVLHFIAYFTEDHGRVVKLLCIDLGLFFNLEEDEIDNFEVLSSKLKLKISKIIKDIKAVYTYKDIELLSNKMRGVLKQFWNLYENKSESIMLSKIFRFANEQPKLFHELEKELKNIGRKKKKSIQELSEIIINSENSSKYSIFSILDDIFHKLEEESFNNISISNTAKGKISANTHTYKSEEGAKNSNHQVESTFKTTAALIPAIILGYLKTRGNQFQNETHSLAHTLHNSH